MMTTQQQLLEELRAFRERVEQVRARDRQYRQMRREAIAAAHNAGMTCPDIARALGVTDGTARWEVMTLKARPGSVTPDDAEAMLDDARLFRLELDADRNDLYAAIAALARQGRDSGLTISEMSRAVRLSRCHLVRHMERASQPSDLFTGSGLNIGAALTAMGAA